MRFIIKTICFLIFRQSIYAFSESILEKALLNLPKAIIVFKFSNKANLLSQSRRGEDV